MSWARSVIVGISLLLICGLGVSHATGDTLGDLKECELKLKDIYAIRHTVVWPGNRIGGSVKGGGASSVDYNIHWQYSKARIATEAGLGDPSLQTIESVRTVDRDVAGDASADATFSGDTVTYSWHIHKDWFGGGATALARIEVVFRQAESDANITSIGQICAAKVLGRART